MFKCTMPNGEQRELAVGRVATALGVAAAAVGLVAKEVWDSTLTEKPVVAATAPLDPGKPNGGESESPVSIVVSQDDPPSNGAENASGVTLAVAAHDVESVPPSPDQNMPLFDNPFEHLELPVRLPELGVSENESLPTDIRSAAMAMGLTDLASIKLADDGVTWVYCTEGSCTPVVSDAGKTPPAATPLAEVQNLDDDIVVVSEAPPMPAPGALEAGPSDLSVESNQPLTEDDLASEPPAVTEPLIEPTPEAKSTQGPDTPPLPPVVEVSPEAPQLPSVPVVEVAQEKPEQPQVQEAPKPIPEKVLAIENGKFGPFPNRITLHFEGPNGSVDKRIIFDANVTGSDLYLNGQKVGYLERIKGQDNLELKVAPGYKGSISVSTDEKILQQQEALARPKIERLGDHLLRVKVPNSGSREIDPATLDAVMLAIKENQHLQIAVIKTGKTICNPCRIYEKIIQQELPKYGPHEPFLFIALEYSTFEDAAKHFGDSLIPKTYLLQKEDSTEEGLLTTPFGVKAKVLNGQQSNDALKKAIDEMIRGG